jgi:hypothetical protein
MEAEDSDLVLTVGPDGNPSPAHHISLRADVEGLNEALAGNNLLDTHLISVDGLEGPSNARRVLFYPGREQAAGTTCLTSDSLVRRDKPQQNLQSSNDDNFMEHSRVDDPEGAGGFMISSGQSSGSTNPGGIACICKCSPPRLFLTKPADCRHSSTSSWSHDIAVARMPAEKALSACPEAAKDVCLDSKEESLMRMSTDRPKKGIHVSMKSLERINEANNAQV